jgi:protocatechuate 3,4-dioxygenase beta subunit
VPTAAGEVILVTGQVLDLAGNPLPGAAVEFWQTDAEGIYDHPGDGGTANRDRGFQFYGTAIADAEGRYVFRTVQPGYYEPRPRHIHVKVKLDGRTLLTTQFYFEEDVATLGNEGLFAQAGSLGNLLILQTADSVDMAGSAVDLLSNDLVVNTGSSGSLTATPAQGEGPYYPVVAVADYDNDLAVVP